MISNIASSGVHAADIAGLRQSRAKKTESAQDTTVETAKTQKSHPANPHGHIPPGLARAAEKIASKIFARADADANGTVTQQELSAVHSKHARTLASSDLFSSGSSDTPAEPISEAAPATRIETSVDADAPIATTETTSETTPETLTEVGVTEAQLKEALTKFFYAKVGVTYTPPAPTTTGQPAITPPADTATPANTTTPSVDDSISGESSTNQPFIAVA